MSDLRSGIIAFLALDVIIGAAIIWWIDRPLYQALNAAMAHAFGAK